MPKQPWTVSYMVRERKGDYLAAVEDMEAKHQALRKKVREWAAMFARKAEDVGTDDCFEADLAKEMRAAQKGA